MVLIFFNFVVFRVYHFLTSVIFCLLFVVTHIFKKMKNFIPENRMVFIQPVIKSLLRNPEHTYSN